MNANAISSYRGPSCRQLRNLANGTRARKLSVINEAG